MTVSEFIVSYLQKQGVTDVFGIPGGVILDFIYTLDASIGITPHLCYHEQSAGFAACGYAQVNKRLGVAYATKGPGFTNLITAIADAYYDSIPVLFITSHSATALPQRCRLIADQDMDTCSMIKNITKYSKRVDNLEEVATSLINAVKIAQSGRKGPTFLDIAANLFKQELKETTEGKKEIPQPQQNENEYVSIICSEIQRSKYPIILIGDGINQSNTLPYLRTFIEKAQIPVLSSRYSHNILADNNYYFGYIGSHGIRYANFILSKADLIISLGNRLYFPSQSYSYNKITQQAKFLRFDIDKEELTKHINMPLGYEIDLQKLLPILSNHNGYYGNHQEWYNICNIFRNELWNKDVNEVVLNISKLLQSIPPEWTLISDVGNNEFWVSRACVFSKINNRTLYSKSFGALGNALGKAIGAYFSTQKAVITFIGDQGIQMNIQELQFIAKHKLPIAIVILNNYSSGMIKDREQIMGYNYSLHTTLDSGYGIPNFSEIAKAYDIKYQKYPDINNINKLSQPILIEMEIKSSLSLTPSLPKGRDCQDMEPRLDTELYNRLNNLTNNI